MKNKLLITFILGIIIFFSYFTFQKSVKPSSLKLYWFIPDGVNADPKLFKLYQWAKEGKLPNIKKLMDRGTYGYSRPPLPGHTPVSFATLITGSWPEVHGVDDGPMRAIGKPLDKIAVPGFRSVARKVPAIWSTLEEAGMKVALISMPGSTPPEIKKGVVLRGRWGGWGADFFALNFETKGDLSQRIKQGRAARLFYFGPQLTQYVDQKPADGWPNAPKSYSPAFEIEMIGWGTPVYGYVYDSTDDNKENYDRVVFSKDKKELAADLKQGEWSDWQPIILKWIVEDKKVDVSSNFRASIIKLGNDGFFRIRIYYANLNKEIAYPPEAVEAMEKETGPMMDFVDNFPQQLGYYKEDRQTFIQESNMSFDWHIKAVSTLANQLSPNVVIHDIYNPTVMLTANWWMKAIDPKSIYYKDTAESERKKAWEEVFEMYKKIDSIIGEIIRVSGNNTLIVFSSDHGNLALNKNVSLNNLFAKNGWLKFTIDPKTGEPIIDWQNSKVIFLKMGHVFINPNGLAGDYYRASGYAYTSLRDKVRQAIEELKDDNGQKPFERIINWEDIKKTLHLFPDRVGDLVIVNKAGYFAYEEMSEDLQIFSKPMATGYKQFVDPNNPGMWTPFMISGLGIKKNNFLGEKPIDHIQQYPTIMEALKIKIPDFVQGKAVEVFE